MFKSIADKAEIDTCRKLMSNINDKLDEVNKLMDIYGECKNTIMKYDGELDSVELKCLVAVMTLRTKF